MYLLAVSRRVALLRGKLLSVLLVFLFGVVGAANAQTLDKEMSGLADKVSKTLVAQGYKNVAAIDFTDLQGQPTELGRYLSERLEVEIVTVGGVSMVDRANIKSILAEHKLTEAGLVNPANAKKLGEFAGVDAILIGNVTALDDGIELMVKAIATSSAKIAAAGRIKFPKTSEIQQLLNRGISSNMAASSASTIGSGTSYQDANAIATKDIGSLRVVLKSVLPLKVKDKRGRSVSGIRCSFEFISRETQKTIAVAMNAKVGEKEDEGNDGRQPGEALRSALVDEHGTEWNLAAPGMTGISTVTAGKGDGFHLSNPTEIGSLLQRQDRTGTNMGTTSGNYRRPYPFVFGSTTPILPGQRLTVVMNFVRDSGEWGSWNSREPVTPEAPPTFFQLNSEIVVGLVTTDGAKSYSLQNLVFDRVSMSAGRGR